MLLRAALIYPAIIIGSAFAYNISHVSAIEDSDASSLLFESI